MAGREKFPRQTLPEFLFQKPAKGWIAFVHIHPTCANRLISRDL